MIDFDTPFRQRGLAATTAAPMSAVEDDTPPGAGDYAKGPLANMPQPTPAPPPQQSLSTIAAGGFNHAQSWQAGQAAPPAQFQQQPFKSSVPNVAPIPRVPAGPIDAFTWTGANNQELPPGY